MPMFDVPGWNVPDKPVQVSQEILSNKRKRPTSERLDLNLDRIMEKIKSTVGGDEKKKDQKKKTQKKEKKEKQKQIQIDAHRTSGDLANKIISRPKPLMPFSGDGESSRPAKKPKTKHDTLSISSSSNLTSSSSGPKLTLLQQEMKQSLDGARFRMINETLYKSESHEASRLMQEDPKVFAEYHTGFRRQVQSWPRNPVQHYISCLSSYSPRTVVADLGCGDAAIAKALIPRGLNVLSYDLVSDGEYVIEADVFERIPLPGSEGKGSEKTCGTAHVVDVVICALSLMGTNWPQCLREAWRIMKPDGELKIAEVASRFTNVEEFQSLVGDIGFRLKSKDDSNTHFTLFEFKKVARKPKGDNEWLKIISRGHILKPCEYKRR